MNLFLLRLFLRRYVFKLRNANLLIGSNYTVKNTSIKQIGCGNKLYISDNAILDNCKILFRGSNNVVRIGKNVRLCGVTLWLEDEGNAIVIGANTTIEEDCQLAACEGTSILIGEDCMFSHSILVRTTDSHTVLDNRRRRINYAKSISIGNHVWVGLRSLILKGTVVPSNCIIAAGAILSSFSSSQTNSVIAGVPAKIVKSEIGWCRERL